MLLLEDMFRAAVAAAQPAQCLPPHLPDPPPGKTIVIGAGKAAAAMAQVVEAHYRGPVSGLIVTRDGHDLPTKHIEVVEARHPIPDARGEAAVRRILALVKDLTPDDLVICLLSGGGSALWPLPAEGLTLVDKQTITEELLRSGASISEINLVRRHLSAIKGGKLAAAVKPARLLTLAISDVPGDDPLAIASGPTVFDPSSSVDALNVLARYEINVSDGVQKHLDIQSNEGSSPWGDYKLIARPADALAAAAQVASEAGFEPVVLSDAVEGETLVGAESHAALARDYAGQGQRLAILSGGELTVRVTGEGIGGPNHEYALALMIALQGMKGVSAIACDTDGTDGTTDAAGAWIDARSLETAGALSLDAESALRQHDSGGFFASLGQQVVTGPTQTNVNDFRAILIDP